MQKMKKIHILIAFFAITVFAQQQEMPQESSKNSSVYLHPIALAGALVADILYFDLTGEFPLNGRHALIVNPHIVWIYGTNGLEEGIGKSFCIGFGVGIRRFVNGNADGLYLQLMPNIGYFKTEDDDRVSSINTDILGYIGYSIKYSKIYWFFDFGVGYGFSHYFSIDKEFKESMKDGPRFANMGAKNGLSFDINIGVGIPFL